MIDQEWKLQGFEDKVVKKRKAKGKDETPIISRQNVWLSTKVTSQDAN